VTALSERVPPVVTWMAPVLLKLERDRC